MELQKKTYIYSKNTPAGDIPADIYFTQSTSSGKRPVVIIFHGGGFTTSSTAMIPKNQISLLASWGFVVVCPEYQLCPQVSLFDGPMSDALKCYSWAYEELPAALKKDSGIDVDGEKIVVYGHSAGGGLALRTGIAHPKPKAIVDFYGSKFLSDPFWHAPLPMFSGLPDLPESFTSQVYTESPPPIRSGPAFINGKPDLSSPRNAWMLLSLKKGTHLADMVKDGDYDRVDPVTSFSKDFPPTLFVQGDKDIIMPAELSKRAYDKLKELGVETEYIHAEGQAHAFDILINDESEEFKKFVVPALEFLKKHV